MVERCEVELSRGAAQRPVRLQRPHESPVATGRRARAEAQQGAVGVAAERRQHGEGLEVRLGAAALLVVEGQLAGQRPPQRARLGRDRKPEDGERQLVVADHVGEVAAADDAAPRREMRGPALRRRLGESQVP